MPGADRTRGLACEMNKAHEHSHHGSSQTPGIPAREWFDGFLHDLPGDWASCHVIGAMRASSPT